MDRMRARLTLCLIAVFSAGCPASMGGTIDGARLSRVRASPNHDGKTFVNNVPTPKGFEAPITRVLDRWLWGRQERRPRHRIPGKRLLPAQLEQPSTSGLRVTWIGHSSVLIEIDGARVLTDPIWSRRASPTPIAGPLRFQDVPIALEELPQLDAVVISHDHYDHLDYETIVDLANTGVPFLVPLGVGAHLAEWDIADAQIIEFDWWDHWTSPSGIEFIATPARHFSGRSLTDRNRTLWASWVIRGPRHRVYFGGDTGFFSGFNEIGEREGPFDIALMPIGSYGFAWPAVHLTPEQAVNAFMMVRGGLFVPIHWGTFNLAFHDWFEPVERLLDVGLAAEIRLAIPRVGEFVEPNVPLPLTRWWRRSSSRATGVVDVQTVR